MKKKKKEKKKEKKLFKIIFLIIILLVMFFSGYSIYRSISKTANSVKKVKTIDKISNFDYSLSDNATKYYKQLFGELKQILTGSELNDEEYAKKVSQLFVTDLFTLSNKLTSSDIGGTQFVYKEYQDDFISIAQDGLYNSVKSNIYGDRKQELPEVSKVEIINCKKVAFKIDKISNEDSYSVDLNISYAKDLGYPNNYNVVLSKVDNKMVVVKSS